MKEMRIWKEELDIDVYSQTLQMPLGAKILDAQMQCGKCVLWFLCNPEAAKEYRKIVIHLTGIPILEKPGVYIATCQVTPNFVVHIFEVVDE